ncbi:MAG: S8 family serine peptidase, partial [Candidatus Bathyarchaeia archaeon]
MKPNTQKYLAASKLDPRLLEGASQVKPGIQRVIVIARDDPGGLGAPMRVGYSFKTGFGFIAVAFIDASNIPTLASDPDVVRVMPDIRLNYNETRLGPEEVGPQTDMFRLRQITGTDEVNSTYGIDGRGFRVAIVDTGVDFGNPDLRDALARDTDGMPIAIDPDEQGLVLTNTTFAANVTATGAVANFSKPLSTHMPPNVTSNVYVTPSGVYLNLSRNDLGTSVSYWFGYGVEQVVLKKDFKIGNDSSHFIASKAGLYSFGLINQSTYYGVDHPFPALVVASMTADIYDTVYVDLSTAYANWTGSFKPDYSFYDEEPHRLGDGTEYLAADYTGDGVPDISAGLLGARVLDIWGVFTGRKFKVDPQFFIWGVREGVPLPGLDPNGTFFGVMFDFYSHGTLCASSIAGRGKTGYDVYDNGTLHGLAGVAPGASIIPAKALWFGDVLYAWMWVSGFDYNPEYRSWVYTGRHKADVVSNSWGISEWPLLDMGVGYDVISILESALTVPGHLSPNYPGTVFVHAGGNGGPGFGTVTVSASSSLAISVGASTSFHWAETVGGEYPAYGGASDFQD